MESTGLHLKMSPPLSETTFETESTGVRWSPVESTGVQLDYVGEGKVLPVVILDRLPDLFHHIYFPPSWPFPSGAPVLTMLPRLFLSLHILGLNLDFFR